MKRRNLLPRTIQPNKVTQRLVFLFYLDSFKLLKT